MSSLPVVKRNILVAVAGQTPAIITETLWALEQHCGVRVDEIRVITTEPGSAAIKSGLLGEEGQFAQFCRDYDVASGRIAFSEKSIHLLLDLEGKPLQDIRDTLDNRAAADRIFSLLREWCGRPGEVLFCSVAGGRKTMGSYLTMALMLCGRREDSLSHVLVSPDFETGVRDFFYPPPEPRAFRCLVGLDKDGKAIYETRTSDQAGIELAEIPFPRLRELIGGAFPLDQGLFEAITRSQLLLAYLQEPPGVTLQLKSGLVTIGQFSFHLSRQLLAVYAFFLTGFNVAKPAFGLDELFGRRHLLTEIERRIDRLRLGDRETYAWDSMRDSEDFRERIGPCISKINKVLRGTLGENRLSRLYGITTGRKYGVSVSRFEILDK
jgi:CRISPR-associated protein (TIGR02584 family)